MGKTDKTCTEQTPDNTSLESSCGIGPCKPRILQRFRTVLSFSLVSGLAGLITQTLLLYIVSQVTALEKQFNLNSTTTGLILSCIDIGFLCIVLFISHFGRNRHIPRIVAAATFLVGFSGILASLGYFISPIYLPKLSDGTLKNLSGQNEFVAPLCGQDNGSDVEKCDDTSVSSTSSGSPTWPIWLFCISMILQGVGNSPKISLTTTYIYNNNSEKTKSGLHIGITATISVLGSALALTLGGVFRSIPVDLVQDTDLDPRHPEWIGAWWLGFLVFGCMSLIIAIPLLFFPKHILPVPDKQLVDKSLKTLENIKDLPRSIFRVFMRKIYTMTLIGVLFQTFVISGIQSFGPKYVENQFMVPANETNVILGVATIISLTIGTFTGGLLTSRLKLSVLGCLRTAILATFLSASCNAMDFFLGCETPKVYGFYDNEGGIKPDNGLSVCSCDTRNYFPVCGEDGMTYFSPCFAGCTNQTLSIYGGCTEVSGGKTTAGMCETDCPYLYYYIAVNALQMAFGTVALMPTYMALIGSVKPRDKTIAVGLFQFFVSLLAFLPGPIFFGYVIDSACIIWRYQCGIKGACAQYDLESLRFRQKSIECGGKGIGLLFFILSYIVLKMQGEDKADDEETEIKGKKSKKTETSRL